MGNSVLFLVRLLFLRSCPLSGGASVIRFFHYHHSIQSNTNNGVDMGLDVDSNLFLLSFPLNLV